MEHGRIQGVSKFLGYPLLSLERVKPRTSNLTGTFTRPIQIKAKNFGEKGAWAYPGTAQFFGYPLFSQERVTPRISNFEGTFTGWIRTKAHEKCWE